VELDLRYPVGRFAPIPSISLEQRVGLIDAIAAFPNDLAAAIEGLSQAQLNTPYREGGWTVRQVVHHVADSHMHAFLRMRTAMAADNPEVGAYDQDAWAGLADSKAAPVPLSLHLIDAIHTRWTWWLRRLTPADFARTVRHPEHDDAISIDFLLQLYAWHGGHHLGHISGLTAREGW